MKNLPCNCTASPFADLNHGPIVTGHIHIVHKTNYANCYAKVSNTENQYPLTFQTAKLKSIFLLIGAIKRESHSIALHSVICLIDKAAKTLLYMKEILCPSTPERIRFIKYNINYLSTSE